MTIRKQLADELTRVTDDDKRSLTQIAASLGYSRQRLNQLRTGDRSAAPEAIEAALKALGYEVKIHVTAARQKDDGET